MPKLNDIVSSIKMYHAEFNDLRQNTRNMDTQVCPYWYQANDNTLQFGLFRPYSAPIQKELWAQAVKNPYYVCITNLYLAVIYMRELWIHLTYFVKTTLGFQIELEPNEDTRFLLNALVDIAAIVYYILHAIIDPAWEFLAAITRSAATFSGGIEQRLPARSQAILQQFKTQLSEYIDEIKTIQHDICLNRFHLNTYQLPRKPYHGLFTPYRTNNGMDTIQDGLQQAIGAPFIVFISHLFIMLLVTFNIAYALYRLCTGEKETALLDISLNTAALLYGVARTITATLWELLAFVTRSVSTIVSALNTEQTGEQRFFI